MKSQSKKNVSQSKKKSSPKNTGEKATAIHAPATTSFPVVGVGASAGGLEAFIELIKAIPQRSGMAFVLVPHLDPTHESAMTELLGRATKLPVLQVQDGMKVTPDHVYVIPPGREMTIRQGVLHLAVRRPQLPPMPIDIFFRSLAEDQRNNA